MAMRCHSLQQCTKCWPVPEYNQFKKKAASYSDPQTEVPTVILVENNQFYHAMTRVTQKGLIITREQYKKMCRSLELSKGIASSYLVKFQMTFHMTANQKQSSPLSELLQPLRVIIFRADISTLHCLRLHLKRFVSTDNQQK